MKFEITLEIPNEEIKQWDRHWKNIKAPMNRIKWMKKVLKNNLGAKKIQIILNNVLIYK